MPITVIDQIQPKNDAFVGLVDADQVIGTTALTLSEGASIDGGLVVNESGADVDFRVEGDTDTHLLFIDAGNDVIGIGTDTPSTSAKLHVAGDGLLVAGNTALPPTFFIAPSGTISQRGSGSTSGSITLDTGTAGTIYLTGAVTINETGGDFDFRVEGDTSQNLLLVDAGNDRVGINTGTPTHQLQVNGDARASNLLADTRLGIGTGGDVPTSAIVEIRSLTPSALYTITRETASTDPSGFAFDLFGARHFNQYYDTELIKVGLRGVYTVNSTTLSYLFIGDAFNDNAVRVYPDKTTQFDNAILPGTNDLYDVGSSTLKWDDIYATNATIQTSDRDRKDQIVASDLGLDFINSLTPVSYKWKDYTVQKEVPVSEDGVETTTEYIQKTFTRKHYGLIAQDVKQVIDSLGTDFAGYIENEDIKGLRYSEFISPIIKSIQELHDIVETQQQLIEELQNG